MTLRPSPAASPPVAYWSLIDQGLSLISGGLWQRLIEF